jgi:serine/threonine protein phosphatase 1
MRTLVIGDIHGCFTALEALLRIVAPVADDRIIALGDYTDRGPDSNLVMQRLVELYDAGQLIALRGNHDEMMLAARDGDERRMWILCGGRETLMSYGHELYDKVYDRIPERHWQFLESDCRDWYETETHLFVHGCIEPDLPMKDQDTWTLRWKKLTGPVVHRSRKILVCGHTKQYDGLPLVYSKTICIDTGAYDSEGWLTCLHLERARYWQANQRGETREGRLDDLR